MNAFLKEQEALRFEAMKNAAGNGWACYPAYDSGDDSSLSNGSGEEGNQADAVAKKRDTMRKTSKPSFGV